MSAVKNHFHDAICAIPFPCDEATGAHYCPMCGEPEADVSVEAFEVFGEAMCPDCAVQLFEDSGLTHILNAMAGADQ
jgi:hypothetical protein